MRARTFLSQLGGRFGVCTLYELLLLVCYVLEFSFQLTFPFLQLQPSSMSLGSSLFSLDRKERLFLSSLSFHHVPTSKTFNILMSLLPSVSSIVSQKPTHFVYPTVRALCSEVHLRLTQKMRTAGGGCVVVATAATALATTLRLRLRALAAEGERWNSCVTPKSPLAVRNNNAVSVKCATNCNKSSSSSTAKLGLAKNVVHIASYSTLKLPLLLGTLPPFNSN